MLSGGFHLTSTAKMFSNLVCQQSPSLLTSCKKWKWDVSSIVYPMRKNISYAVMILNRPVQVPEKFMTGFWNNAQIRITIDGGTTKWENYVKELPEASKNSIKDPDLITGDFDSIHDDTLENFKQKGCKIIHTPDQMFTDFTKGLMTLNSHCQESNLKLDCVVAICQSSGRLDQTLGNIQTLFLAKELHLTPPNTDLYLLSDDSLSWLLSPGEHLIEIPKAVRSLRKVWCSLVPIGARCDQVTTSGLKWNLDNQPLAFGELVSTSNTYDGSEHVKVSCSHPLLWSMKIPVLQ